MTRQIEFWREVGNSAGVRCRSVLVTFDIADDTPDVEAIEDAIRRFCDIERVSDWRRLADGYDVRMAGTVVPRVLVPWDRQEFGGSFPADEEEDEPVRRPRRPNRPHRASPRIMRRPSG